MRVRLFASIDRRTFSLSMNFTVTLPYMLETDDKIREELCEGLLICVSMRYVIIVFGRGNASRGGVRGWMKNL